MVQPDVEPDRGEPGTETIARESELSQLRGFVLGEAPERALVMSGPPGVGKTTLWEAAVSMAREGGLGILRARAAEAETSMPFATLSDLFDGVGAEILARIPTPQQRAIDVALLRAEPTALSSEPHAIALGVLNILRSSADSRPMLVAVDDVQWADAASTDALAFALRRLSAERIRVLLSRRTGRRTPVESAIGRAASIELVVGGLSLGALRRLLRTRLGLTFPRRLALQLLESTLGNPLFALEIGRALTESGVPAIGEGLPLPDSLDDLLGARVTASADARRALLAVALGGGLTVADLAAVVGEEAADAALDASLLVQEHGRLRPSHPLFATSAIHRSSTREQRALHRLLAGIAPDPVRRARHLASAAEGPDPNLAAIVAAGAAGAVARGATEQAIELAGLALKLTPAGDVSRDEHVLRLGEYLHLAGEGPRLKQLFDAELGTLAPGEARARGHLLLARVPDSVADYEDQLDAALRESTGFDEIRTQVLAEQSIDASMSWLERLDEAEAKALEALALAPAGRSRAEALFAVAWVRIMRGLPIADLRSSRDDDAERVIDYSYSLERVEGIRLAFRGCLKEARAIFVHGQAQAIDHGQEEAGASYALQRCELELRAGNRVAAERIIDEIETWDDTMPLGTRSNTARLRSLAAALRGDAEDAGRWAAKTIELVVGQRWDELEARRARGVAALAAGEPRRAVDDLLAVWRHTEAEGIADPGAFPVAPDLVEAAHAVGDGALAAEVSARLAELCEAQGHPWGLASVWRCHGLAALAAGDDDDVARADLLAAADRYDELGCHFDAARTLLALGRHARRSRKWGEARHALERSVGTFERLGCDGWAAQGRDLLGKVGGRRPSDTTTLTPTERRVADLASRGSSNKEIAAALFVGVHTVEVHLSHAYAKLGVRSRAQLTRALGGESVEGAPGNI